MYFSDEVWALLTFPTYTQLIYPLQVVVGGLQGLKEGVFQVRSFVLTLFIFKAPNYVLARTLTERVV